ncbi:helix-turn-helix domain-containing protein [Anaerosinus massiliensis]|uniref:helix-turn-helix domain-containing protein n=1 Tax=Massilibacillus massiliensis TaxID=1806837 RepID=UPI0018FE05FC|nr:helix-turn-helix transcriptional regulator [Massilibacillus massiliensis]
MSYDPSNLKPPGNSVGERVRWARQKKNLTQVELAKRVSCVATTIIIIEKTGRYNISTLKKISIVVDQPIEFLGCFENMPETTFGDRLKKARYYHGYDKKEAAEIVGFNQRTLYDWERGKREPSVKALDKLVSFINILNQNSQ